MIPLKYNVRNLRVRWKTTLMTVLGTGLVVWSSCILFGLVDGLEHSLTISGDPLDLIVMRKGSTNETTGGFETAKADELLNLPGHRPRPGRPAVGREGAPEYPDRRTRERDPDQYHRSWGPGGLAGAPTRFPDRRRRRTSSKVAESASSARTSRKRFKGAQIGGVLNFGDQEIYHVVGVFTAGGSAAESEVWADLKDVEKNTGRDGSVSCVQLRAASPDDYRKLQETIETDTRFKLAAIPESVYFQNQSRSSIFLKGAGTLIAVLLTFGAMFAAANTMFAAVGARTREIGTMRALGFSQLDILICFMGESLILCALGGVAGVLAAIPLNALTYETSDFNSFASMTVAFRFGPMVMGVACLMTLAMGLFGGMFPAIRAVRLDVISALREL